MQVVTINPSIAVIMNIDPVGHKEMAPIYMEAEENWQGVFTIKVWNSEAKNTEHLSQAVPTEDKVMTLTINPENQSLPVGKLYYEITNDQNRVVFKGDLNIIK